MRPTDQWGDFNEMGEMEEQSASLEGNKCSSLLFQSSGH